MHLINFNFRENFILSDSNPLRSNSVKMKEMPSFDRPYEKLEKYGASQLTDSELLAIIIKNGNKKMCAMTIAQKIMSLNKDCLGLPYLINAPIEDLIQISGIGKIKAITIKAAVELGIRANKKSKDISNTIIKSPSDIFLYLREDMQHLTYEKLKIVLLDSKNSVMKVSDGGSGTVSEAVVSPRIIFKDALKYDAASIILAHNHPSGNHKPSTSDIETTRSLIGIGKSIGVNVLDHLVIGKDDFTSIQSLLI